MTGKNLQPCGVSCMTPVFAPQWAIMRSMTGYGRGEACHKGFKFAVELNSVNRKQLDVVLSLPPELAELDSRVREEIHETISRGRLNVTVAWHRAEGGRHNHLEVDEGLAKSYLTEIRRLQKSLGLSGAIGIETLLRQPGIIRVADRQIEVEGVWPFVREALRKALAQLVVMRKKEGDHLRKDLAGRLALLEKDMISIRKLAPKMVERYREQLRKRVAEAGVSLASDDQHLSREVVLFADRSDITEELTRLQSHLKQFRDSFDAKGPVGRVLDFLVQELNREVNTIGSKANAAEITSLVVNMKSELEKIREQIQNVE
ncbi:MAG: YicC family protein [Verrucomicrobiae bacterium]|nr:YicC family protein [Verrucomicrobiae bacterium]